MQTVRMNPAEEAPPQLDSPPRRRGAGRVVGVVVLLAVVLGVGGLVVRTIVRSRAAAR